MKKCNRCNVEKKESKFFVDNDKKDKLTTICKECISFRRNKKKEIVNTYIRLYKGCACCGYNKIYDAIDLHHMSDEDKFKNISKMETYSDKRLIKELHKTVPLCKNCHTEHHANVGISHSRLEEIRENALGLIEEDNLLKIS